ncbi:MAG: hypothetical protein FWE36_02545 [Erysipelotrichales bacterium]|nr:hypothetical protein [Erysipelotrichales bacterium]
MKFKNWQRIYTLLLWLSLVSFIIFMSFGISIDGLNGYFGTWYAHGMTISAFVAIISTVFWTIIKGLIDLAAKENKLILKDFGKPESKDKTYYFYNTGVNQRFNHKIRILNQSKKFHELKFTPKGLFVNAHWFFLLDAKEQLFLWEDIRKVIITPNEITIKFHKSNKIENKASRNMPLLVGNSYYAVNKTDSYCYMLNDLVFIKLIKTFYEGEIEETAG